MHCIVLQAAAASGSGSTRAARASGRAARGVGNSENGEATSASPVSEVFPVPR